MKLDSETVCLSSLKHLLASAGCHASRSTKISTAVASPRLATSGINSCASAQHSQLCRRCYRGDVDEQRGHNAWGTASRQGLDSFEHREFCFGRKSVARFYLDCRRSGSKQCVNPWFRQRYQFIPRCRCCGANRASYAATCGENVFIGRARCSRVKVIQAIACPDSVGVRINQAWNDRTTAGVKHRFCFAFPLTSLASPDDDTSGNGDRRLLHNLQIAHGSRRASGRGLRR